MKCFQHTFTGYIRQKRSRTGRKSGGGGCFDIATVVLISNLLPLLAATTSFRCNLL
jgi:hypothetical protein